VGVPAVQALFAQAHAAEAIEAGADLETRARQLNDLRRAALVEHVLAAEPMQEGAAVVTVAEGAIHRRWRDLVSHAAHRATPAANQNIDGHRFSVIALRP